LVLFKDVVQSVADPSAYLVDLSRVAMETRSSWKKKIPSFKAKGKFPLLPNVNIGRHLAHHPNWKFPPKAPGPYMGSVMGQFEALDTTTDSLVPMGLADDSALLAGFNALLPNPVKVEQPDTVRVEQPDTVRVEQPDTVKYTGKIYHRLT
jgi:hypothetical protein